jgi:hypothetical protein
VQWSGCGFILADGELQRVMSVGEETVMPDQSGKFNLEDMDSPSSIYILKENQLCPKVTQS